MENKAKRNAYLILILIFLIYVVSGSSVALLGSAWPAINVDIGVPISWQSIIIVTTYVAATIGAATAQHLLARFRTWAPATVGVLIVVAAIFWFSAAHIFVILPIAGALIGYIFGVHGAIANSYVTKHYKAMWISWLHCFFSLGGVLGPAIISYFIISSGSWRMGYQAVASIHAAIFVLLLISFPLWSVHGPVLPSRKKTEGSESVVPSDTKTISNSKLIKLPGGKSIPATMFFYCSFETTFCLWAASYLTEDKGLSPGVAAAMMAVFFSSQVVSRIITGFLSAKISDRMIVRVAMIVIVLGIISFYLSSGTFIAISIVILGISTGPAFPFLIHEVPSIVGNENAQGVIGLQLAAGNIGVAFIPMLMGFFVESVGFVAFPVLLLVLIGGALLIKSFQDSAAKKRESIQ